MALPIIVGTDVHLSRTATARQCLPDHSHPIIVGTNAHLSRTATACQRLHDHSHTHSLSLSQYLKKRWQKWIPKGPLGAPIYIKYTPPGLLTTPVGPAGKMKIPAGPVGKIKIPAGPAGKMKTPAGNLKVTRSLQPPILFTCEEVNMWTTCSRELLPQNFEWSRKYEIPDYI